MEHSNIQGLHSGSGMRRQARPSPYRTGDEKIVVQPPFRPSSSFRTKLFRQLSTCSLPLPGQQASFDFPRCIHSSMTHSPLFDFFPSCSRCSRTSPVAIRSSDRSICPLIDRSKSNHHPTSVLSTASFRKWLVVAPPAPRETLDSKPYGNFLQRASDCM